MANKAEKFADKAGKVADAVDPNNIGDTVQKAKNTVKETKDKAVDAAKKAPEKVKETAKKAKEAAKKAPEKEKEVAKKTKKAIKNAPKKAKNLALKGKKQVSQAVKKAKKTADYIRKNPAQAAEKVGNLAKTRGKNFLHRHNPVTKVKKKVDNVKKGIKATRRILRAARKAAKNVAKAIKNIGKVIEQVGSKIITFLVSNPIGWVIDIILICILLVVLILNFGNDEEDSSLSNNMMQASGTAWEQFKKYVELREGGGKDASGQYYMVENDGAGYPTVGHGLCLKSGSGYLHVEEFIKHGVDSKQLADNWLNGDRNGKVSVEICDSIWEDNLKDLYDNVKATLSDLNLKEYQIYALVDVKYRRGNINGFRNKYESLWSSNDDQFGQDISKEPYSESSLFSFFWNGGHSLEGVNKRKKAQWLLFKYGYYDGLNEYYTAGTGGGNYDSSFYGGINIYNDDGSVNTSKINELDNLLTKDYLNTTHHVRNYANQGGPFKKWWTNNGLQKFQCTWWANGRASQYLELNGSKYKTYPTISGNGGDYYSYNKSNGWFNYGTTPKRNSVISWTYGDYGHVAYVEAVDAMTGDIWISHAGGGWSWFELQKCTKASNYSPWSGYSLNGFIYLDEPK